MAQRSIFVSGGVAGIGRAVAERFHAAGWFVGVYASMSTVRSQRE